ncbi:restriction endonuclease [Luteimonas sp. RD2P54]|uniref:Restriction endonuclease n=1 Tax=Luteimonas endophytica TaxID=3042023 RepID=A0ABT6J3W0_9GAMM|nr:restriction endonuclease [Luteimonas endophytica]MDH5821511.1 restriction endonuclease [Luteimonas endophytica]
MSAGLQWAVVVAVVLLLGGAATLYIRKVLLRRDETESGISALSGTSWREFIHLVLEALARRGFNRVFDHEVAAGDKDYTLERDGRRWLLSCKHGSAFVLGNATVKELANDVRLANASGGFLFTQGKISDEARRTAAMHNIELLDGATLWPELRDLVRPEQLAGIRAAAARRARQRTILAWLLAVLAGIAVYLLLPPRATGPAEAAPAAAPAAARPAPGQAPDQVAAPAADATGAPQAGPALTAAQQREAVVSAIATLPMVDRAFWATQSTLEVVLLDTQSDAMAAICPLVERYPELAASRVQLTPPAESDVPVRFRQCRTY